MITELARHLTPVSQFIPSPPASDRPAWEALPAELKARLIAEGEAYIGYSFPPILATDFMAFCRTGNRTDYENKLFQRRNILNALVLAECVEYKGRFLDDIINAIFLICEESAWQLPAHNSYIRDMPQLILPDVTRPVVDLFAAEAGAILAVAEYLLRDAFRAVSPAVSKNINHHLRTRVLKPYLTEHFWWMGDGVSPMNNWTAWCTQNVLLAAFTRGDDGWSDYCRQIFPKACRSLDYFLREYGDDGCCDEGAQYYRHAGLTLLGSLEILNGVTNGGFSSVYKNRKVRNMAAYILNAHIDGPYYVNFADCSPIAGRCNAREYLFGKRTDNPQLMAFAARDYLESEDPLTLQEHNLFYRLLTIFTHEEMTAYGQAQAAGSLPKASCHCAGHDFPADKPDVYTPGLWDSDIHPSDIHYPSTGLFITRDRKYYLAVKAGDNDDSHNHNDTGSFTVYKHGKPLFIDVGVESYTRKTFSPQRYEIWTMQSAYHNLPSIGGVMQKAGKDYGARDVSWKSDTRQSWITMDIAGAYSPCGLYSYVRTAVLNKGKSIVITDTFQSSAPVILTLMTYEKPTIIACAAPASHLMQIGDLGQCVITGATRLETEEIPITDSRLAQAWKHSVYRTLVTAADSSLILTIT